MKTLIQVMFVCEKYPNPDFYPKLLVKIDTRLVKVPVKVLIWKSKLAMAVIVLGGSTFYYYNNYYVAAVSGGVMVGKSCKEIEECFSLEMKVLCEIAGLGKVEL